MLLAEALTRLLYLWDVNVLSDIPDELVRDRIPVVLIQILNQTLLNEASGRGWSSKTSPEILAYRILTLKAVHSLPSHALLYDSILFDIHSGQQILSQCQDDWAKPAPLWIEKVTYGSTILSEAYCLASMFTLQPSHKWSPRVISLLEMPEKAILKTTKFLGTLTCFQSEPHWKLRASAIEGFTFLPQLKSVRADILPRQTNAKNEYIAYIPLTWILINNLRSLDTSADILWDMMVLTVCNFRMDEYMETAAAKFSRADLEGTKPIIADLFANDRPRLLQTQNLPDADSDNNLRDHGVILNASSFNGDDIPATAKKPEPNGVDVAAEASLKYVVSSLVSFRAIIGHYVRSMLAYPLILDASPADRFNLRSLLATFLLSHIAQIEDNLRFSTQMSWSSSGTSIFASPRTTFHSWAHSTGADSVSCPFSFAFFTCLLGASLAQSPPGRKSPAADCFTSVRQKYLAEQLCSHLAVMSRLYNDFGSLARDRLEANINSVNFPEFHPLSRNSRSWSGEDSQAMKEGYLKRELLELAELERRNSDQAQERLISDIEADTQGAGARIRMRKVKAVRLFAGVTGLYADIYVARDLSNRIEKNG